MLEFLYLCLFGWVICLGLSCFLLIPYASFRLIQYLAPKASEGQMIAMILFICMLTVPPAFGLFTIVGRFLGNLPL